MMPKTILAFGEVLWDLLPRGEQIGGAPFNFIFRVSNLGDRGVMVSRLGQDERGDRAAERIAELALDLRHIQRDGERPTGTVPVTFDENRQPTFIITADVAFDHIEPMEALLAAAGEADCVCFGTLIQRCGRSRETLHRVLDAAGEAVKLLDINLRKDCYTRETVAESLARADVLKLNDAEAADLDKMLPLGASGDLHAAAAALCERFDLRAVVVTLGERGALAVAADGQAAYSPGYVVELVDPVGSGDAFTAGFVHKYLRGATLDECCGYGNALGALVATQEGATAPLTAQEIETFLAGDPERNAAPERLTTEPQSTQREG